MKQIYSCNICSDNKLPNHLIGCNFKNLTEFKLANARKTDGTHICVQCAQQLKDQLDNVTIIPGITKNTFEIIIKEGH